MPNKDGISPDSLSKSLKALIKRLRGLPVVDENSINDITLDLQKILISADIKVDIVETVIQRVKNRALADRIAPGLSRVDYAVKILYDELVTLLGKRHWPLRLDPDKTSKIMFVGVQGSGKTSSLSKMAVYLKKRGKKIGVIGADTFRPGAYLQLKQLLSPYNIEVFGYERPEKNALRVVKDGLTHFYNDKKVNVILIDTSGRHKDENSLFEEMKAISDTSQLDEIILVVDGTTGQRAYEQSETFNRTVRTESLIITKLDGSAKGGGSISAVVATGAKIRFITNGEKIDDIQEFNPEEFVESLIGKSDLRSILQQVDEISPMESSEGLETALKKGKITLKSYKQQLEFLENKSSFGKILSLAKGTGPQLPLGFEKQSKKNLKRYISICSSMTEEELENSKKIKASQIKRIARGSGTGDRDVKELLKHYKDTNDMLKRFKGSRKKRFSLGGKA